MSTNPEVQAPTLDEIRAAESRLAGFALRTPLIRLNHPDTQADIYLKLENLQPVGAFKIRSMGNILKSTDPQKLRQGVYTASSGNSGYALAWLFKAMGILRASDGFQEVGKDVEINATAYPESIKSDL